jgi:hypothetical protein
MKASADKSPYIQRHTATRTAPQQQGRIDAELQFVDNRAETTSLRQFQEAVDNSPRRSSMEFQTGLDNVSVQRIEDEEVLQGEFSAEPPAQLSESAEVKLNNTGLPDNLRAGVESLSGLSMDNVKVHYNSSQPAQLNAHAYAQGADIHVGPGQEQHIPHEAWHVVQQAQGRVKPTLQMKDGVGVNDDQGLEVEADLMGGRAKAGVVQARWELSEAIESNPIDSTEQRNSTGKPDDLKACSENLSSTSIGDAPIQRKLADDGNVGEIIRRLSDDQLFRVTNKEFDRQMSQLMYMVEGNGVAFLVPDSNPNYAWEIEFDKKFAEPDKASFRPGMTLGEVEGALGELRNNRDYEVGVVFEGNRLKRVVRGSAAKKSGKHASVDVKLLLNADGEHGSLRAKASQSILTHNHPTGLPLSDGDIASAAAHNIEEIRAVGLTVFSMRRNGDEWHKGSKESVRLDLLIKLAGMFPTEKNGDWVKEKLGLEGIKHLVVDSEIKVGDNWIDLGEAKTNHAANAFAHYRMLSEAATKMGWTLDDGIGNNFLTYAKLVLQTYLDVNLDDYLKKD